MAYEGKCDQNIKPVGVGKVCVDWSSVLGFWRTVPDLVIPAADIYKWETYEKLIAERKIFPFPNIFKEEFNDEDVKNEEGANGFIQIGRGKKNSTFYVVSNPYKDSYFQTHSGAPSGIIHISATGAIRGVKDSEDNFLPIPVQLFQVLKPEENDNDSIGFKSKIQVIISDVNTYLDDVAIIEKDDLDFNPLNVEDLTPITLSVTGTPTATTLIIRANISNTTIGQAGFSENPGEDFAVLEPDGITLNVPTAISDDGSGQYTLTFTALVTGSKISFLPPDLMITQGFEGINTPDITFP